MAKFQIPRITIAGTHSGVGKTTIVTGLLGALKRQGLSLQSYKVGPDYIDPGYHRLASGKAAHNLDTWLVPPEKLGAIFRKTSQGSDLAVIEGVMGLYDGGRKGISSTAAIAKLLHTPVILVIDAKAMGESAAAVVLGFKDYDPKVNLAGVIINRLGSKNHEHIIREALLPLGIPVLGCIFRRDALATPERHLGLTPVTEHEAMGIVDAMIDEITAQVNLEKILEIAHSASPLRIGDEENAGMKPPFLRIGVAQDEVFTFYYPESLDTLRRLGAEIVPFSPLHDTRLPDGLAGLILGGGFPEMFIRELSANAGMLQDIACANSRGMPIYAECGGLMYLCRQIVDFSGTAYTMAQVVPAVCEMQAKLQTVGYVEARALTDTVCSRQNGILRGHEFHFSRMTPDMDRDFPWAFEFTKMSTGQNYRGGYAAGNILASYLHMHFAGNEQAAGIFMEKCLEYKKNNLAEKV
jgi:cobyrinic acid a,c-diamide synthase